MINKRKNTALKINSKGSPDKIFKSIIQRLADSPLPEITFLATFILSRWWLNSDFSYPTEIIIPIVMFSLLAIVIFYIYRLILGKGFATHVAALLLSYGLYQYTFIQNSRILSHVLNVIPGSLKTDFTKSIILLLTLGLLCGLFAWSLNRLTLKYKTLRDLQLYKVVLFAVLFAFSIQIIRFTDRYLEIREGLAYKYSATALSKPTASNSNNRPDIYYVVFDRYGNNEMIQNNFNYDNSEITDFLSSNDFVNRQQAYSNYPFTMSSVSSTMAMNYLPELKDKFNKPGQWQPTFPYRSILKDPPIAQTLKLNGYKYNQLSSWWDFTRVGINADTNPTQSFRLSFLGNQFYLSDLTRDILNKSIFSPWLKKGITIDKSKLIKYDLDRNPQENFESQMEALNAIYNRGNKSTPQFTFAHILAPHPPYVFDEKGNHPSYDPEANDNGVDESVKYVNELKYINKRMKELINGIKTSSPNAVIILQADEGPYPKQFRGDITLNNYYDPLKLPESQLKQKFGILASYHMPGVEDSELEQLNSPVNAFRFILNNYLGYSLPMLPDCNFSMGNKFGIFSYALVTDKLTGAPASSECKNYE